MEQNAALTAKIKQQQQELADLEDKLETSFNENLGLQRKLAGEGKERTAAVLLTGSGEVNVELDGAWSMADLHRIMRPMMRAIRQQRRPVVALPKAELEKGIN